MAAANSDGGNRRDDSGERGSDERGGRDSQERDDIEELASRTLRIQSKRYYVDVKQNSRGRFIKLVEGLSTGQKNRMNIPMVLVPEFRDKLNIFAEFHQQLDPNATREGEDGRLRSDIIRGAGRRIYMDLKENNRGVFLRISCAGGMSQRSTIALPAQGIVEVKTTLTELLDEFGTEETSAELPESKEMRIERKRFYFDCGRNDRGSFLRVSEVTSNYRSSITVPKQGLAKFREILGEIIDKLDH